MMDSAIDTLQLCCSEDQGYWNLEKNSTGHFLSKEGIFVETLDWLAIAMKFKYECLPKKDSESFTWDNVTKKEMWTSLYRLRNGQCSVAVNSYAITYDRFKDFDFLHPLVYQTNSLLIPEPTFALGGISSVWRPFEDMVWVALLTSLAITMALSLFDWMHSYKTNNNGKRGDIDLHWLFLFGLLVSKAGFRAPDKLRMRLVGGAWCISALILTNYYSSVLTSLITSATPQPLVNSVEELANKDNVGLVVVKGYNIASTIAIRSNPITKKLDDKLKSNPDSLCPRPMDCIAQVAKTGSNKVFIDAHGTMMAGMIQYLHNGTGDCHLTLAKGSFGNTRAAFAISKNSPLFEPFQRGLLRIVEAGLLNEWESRFLSTPHQCPFDFEGQDKLARIRNPDLVNLSSLYSVFICLIIGWILSFLILLTELVASLFLHKP